MVRSPSGTAARQPWQPIDPDHGGLRRAAPWAYQVVVLHHDRTEDRPPDLARLRAARLQAGLTQRQLAALLGVARATVTRWEAGDAPIPADRHRQWLDACTAPTTEKETRQ